MDIRVYYWKGADGSACSKEYDGACLKSKVFERCNENFVAGLAAAAYGIWDLRNPDDTLLEIYVKRGRDWHLLSGSSLRKDYLKRHEVPKDQEWLRGNDLGIYYDGETAYYHPPSAKFIDGLNWVKMNVDNSIELNSCCSPRK